MSKPNFLKTENPDKGLCKLLKGKAEKGVRGENGALMKKGLRPNVGFFAIILLSVKTVP